AVYDGPAYDALRGELTQALKVFEERSWRQLGTWEDATTVAESAANELSNFLEHPERTTPPRLPKVSPPEVKSGKVSWRGEAFSTADRFAVHGAEERRVRGALGAD